MNDVILAVYDENALGLGLYYDPSKLSTEVANSPEYRVIRYSFSLGTSFQEESFIAPLHLLYISC
jgi:hypothetical protein